MDRAGSKTSQLSSEEMTAVFDLVSQGGGSEEARRLLAAQGRNRTTANRLYNVVRELEARGLNALDTPTAQEIAEAARYSTTPQFVQSIHLRWRAWRNRANPCQDRTHQEFLRDRLILLMLELGPLLHSFPGVFRLSYRPEDPTSQLSWLEEGGQKRMKWELGAENQPGWSLVEQHLTSGMPEAAGALSRVKQSYAAYCERLLTLNDIYRARVREQQARTAGSLLLNESHFFRSILAEVDRPSEPGEGSEYRYSGGPGHCSVAFEGVQLLSRAEDGAATREWVELHQQWRIEMRSEHLAGLVQLRQDIQDNARMAVAAIERLDVGGRVPGKCDRFP